MEDKKSVTKSVFSKSDDGTIQITLSFPTEDIEKARDKALKHFSEHVTVEGFRKGKAPIDKVMEKVNPNDLVQETLKLLIPKALSEAYMEHKISPVIYPRLELIKANENEPWEVSATTCEMPEVNLPDNYIDIIKKELSAVNIIVPGKDVENEKEQELKNQEKAIETLIKMCNLTIPKILIDQDVEINLSQLLARLEKLGVSMENYLASIGKDIKTLREEYEQNAKDSISIEIILNKIVEQKNITVDKKAVDEVVKSTAKSPDSPNANDTPEQRRIIESVLKRRKALLGVIKS